MSRPSFHRTIAQRFLRPAVLVASALALGACAQTRPARTPTPTPTPTTPTTPPSSISTSPFNITVVFTSTLTSSQVQAFRTSAERWAKVITSDLEDGTVTGTQVQQSCGVAGASGREVDDVVIYARVVKMDGRGGILGRAGPCIVRGGTNVMPAVGVMEFDLDDLAVLEREGMLTTTIMHEMGHVLGFGTLWDETLTEGTGSTPSTCGTRPTFTGTQAKAEWNALGGSGNVPLEPGDGAEDVGTCDSHWQESVFGAELMTGYINAGRSNPLSRLTVGALRDMGYSVNYAGADAYTRPVVPLSAEDGYRPNVTLVRPKLTLP